MNPGRNPDSTIVAGTTFLGQFVDHDVTFDLTSQLGVPTPPEATRNFRESRSAERREPDAREPPCRDPPLPQRAACADVSAAQARFEEAPTLPAAYSGGGEFRMIDFLAFAGVAPA